MKVSAILLTGAAALTLGACSGQDDSKSDPAANTASPPSTEAPTGGVTTPDPGPPPATVPPTGSAPAGTPQTPPTLPEEPGMTPDNPATQPPA